MKPKMMVKISIDFVMTILLLLLMARKITGESAHEWLGAGMFLLWVVHHILNFKWHGNLSHNPHFKWGFDFNPSGVFYWFRQRRDFAVPFLQAAS